MSHTAIVGQLIIVTLLVSGLDVYGQIENQIIKPDRSLLNISYAKPVNQNNGDTTWTLINKSLIPSLKNPVKILPELPREYRPIKIDLYPTNYNKFTIDHTKSTQCIHLGGNRYLIYDNRQVLLFGHLSEPTAYYCIIPSGKSSKETKAEKARYRMKNFIYPTDF